MPDYFKKRKGPQGPNKNEEKVSRARSAENQARLASKFPTVGRLRIRLTFLDARQQILEEKALSFGPSDAAVFHVLCPGRCGVGSFNFEAKIAETVNAGLAVSDSAAKCGEPLYAGSIDACGCEIKCRMEIDYRA